ncbi:rCG40978 [Rattus norvegicus]|uniref:RCG40978 n=1 Tax=Rattus norvegicus TaxID=10116 RepID=A6KUX1_RAT|nr:rCG40978 [Rattus norvegicus]
MESKRTVTHSHPNARTRERQRETYQKY